MPDYGDPGWFQSFELGHQGYSEFLVYWDLDDDTDKVDQFYVDTAKMNIKNRFYTSLLGPHQPLYLTGPKYGPNYHEFLLKVKNEFDPKWKSHPPVPLAHDVFVQALLRNRCRRLAELRTGLGEPLPANAHAKIKRLLARLELVLTQIAELRA